MIKIMKFVICCFQREIKNNDKYKFNSTFFIRLVVDGYHSLIVFYN